LEYALILPYQTFNYQFPSFENIFDSFYYSGTLLQCFNHQAFIRDKSIYRNHILVFTLLKILNISPEYDFFLDFINIWWRKLKIKIKNIENLLLYFPLFGKRIELFFSLNAHIQQLLATLGQPFLYRWSNRWAQREQLYTDIWTFSSNGWLLWMSDCCFSFISWSEHINEMMMSTLY
jgi:hypothetical protein